jgi:hypothetical protein
MGIPSLSNKTPAARSVKHHSCHEPIGGDAKLIGTIREETGDWRSPAPCSIFAHVDEAHNCGANKFYASKSMPKLEFT